MTGSTGTLLRQRHNTNGHTVADNNLDGRGTAGRLNCSDFEPQNAGSSDYFFNLKGNAILFNLILPPGG